MTFVAYTKEIKSKIAEAELVEETFDEARKYIAARHPEMNVKDIERLLHEAKRDSDALFDMITRRGREAVQQMLEITDNYITNKTNKKG